MSGDDFVVLEVHQNQVIESDQKNPYNLIPSSRLSIGSGEERKGESTVGEKVSQMNQF